MSDKISTRPTNDIDPNDAEKVAEMVQVIVKSLTTPEALEYHNVSPCPPVADIEAAVRLLFPFFSAVRSVGNSESNVYGVGSLLLEPNERFSLNVYPGGESSVIGLHKPHECPADEALDIIHRAFHAIESCDEALAKHDADNLGTPDRKGDMQKNKPIAVVVALEDMEDEEDETSNVPPTVTKH